MFFKTNIQVEQHFFAYKKFFFIELVVDWVKEQQAKQEDLREALR